MLCKNLKYIAVKPTVSVIFAVQAPSKTKRNKSIIFFILLSPVMFNDTTESSVKSSCLILICPFDIYLLSVIYVFKAYYNILSVIYLNFVYILYR